MRSSYFWMILMVFAVGILVNARKKKPRSCKGKNGQTYAVGKGYVEDCITYTCFKNGKMKAKGEKCPEIICKGKNGGLYKVGEGYSEKCISYTCSISGFMTATQVPGCSLPTTPLITTTTPSGTEAPNCMSCAYENRVYQFGDTIIIKEKCTILTCVGGNVGLHWTIDVLGASCCQFNGKLLKEGEQVQLYNEQVAKCCKGEMVSVINDTVILRSGCLFGPKDNSRLYPLNTEIKDGCIYYKCQFGIDQEFSDEFDQMVNYTFVPIKEDETCCSSNEGMVPNGWVGNENYVDFSCINGNMTVNFTTTETHFDDEYPLSKEELDYNLDTYVNYCLSSQEDDQNLIENMGGEMRNTASICNDAVPYTTNSTETNCKTCDSMVQGQKCGQNEGHFYMNCIDCCGTSSSQCTEWRCDAGGWLCRKPCPQDWTIIQRRGQYGNAEDYFYKDFNDYENGFGSVDDELWIGLKSLTDLTKDGEWELRVDLTDWDNKAYHAKYGTFSVGPAPTYKLHVEGYDDGSSTLGDSMEYHNGQSFSARNKDQDSNNGNCAEGFRGGWWYNSCHHSNLNGLNYAKQVQDSKGISWAHGKARGAYSRLTWKASVMKIRKVQGRTTEIYYFYNGVCQMGTISSLQKQNTENIFDDQNKCIISCLDPCKQPPPPTPASRFGEPLDETARCNELSESRYYFNGKECIKFRYDGCSFNRNNFLDKDLCQFTCMFSKEKPLLVDGEITKTKEQEEFCSSYERKVPNIKSMISKFYSDVNINNITEAWQAISQQTGNNDDLGMLPSKRFLSNIFGRHLKWASVTTKDCVQITVKVRYRCMKMPFSDTSSSDFNNICDNLISQGIKRHFETTFNYGSEVKSINIIPIRVSIFNRFSKLYVISKNCYKQTSRSGLNMFLFDPIYIRACLQYFPLTNVQDAEGLSETLAHELGHDVLWTLPSSYFGGWIRSWTHKGTSTMFSQDTLTSAPFYPSPPGPVDGIDLMYYYNGAGDHNMLTNNNFLGEEDAQHLVEKAIFRNVGHCGGRRCGPCLFGGMCQAGLKCRWFRCVECTSDGDCNSNQYCFGKNNPLFCNECRAKKPDGSWCTRDAECINFCHGFRCTECEKDYHCPANEYCKNRLLPGIQNKCRPKKSDGSWCTRDAECQNYCDGFRCAECEHNYQCPNGEYCKNKNLPFIKNYCKSKCKMWCWRDSDCSGSPCDNCKWYKKCK